MVVEAFFAEVEGAAGATIWWADLGAIVETPAGGAAFDGAFKVAEEIFGGGFPAFGVAVTEGFLEMNGDLEVELFETL